MSTGKSPDAMRGPASGFLIDQAEKDAQDRQLFGGTGGDGDNGNAGKPMNLNPGSPATTGDGSSHWSKH